MPSRTDASGKRSGGPKTIEGKARVAQNAKQHGLSNLMLPGEMTFDQTQSVYAYACSVQDAMTLDLENAFKALIARDGPEEQRAFERALKRLGGLERYISRAFTKRQTAIRRGLADDSWPDIELF